MLPDDYDLPSYDGPTISFVIQFDPECEDAALLFARRLFAELDERIEALSLVPGATGDFEVWLDDDHVHTGAGVSVEPSAQRSVKLAWTRLQYKDPTTSRDGKEDS